MKKLFSSSIFKISISVLLIFFAINLTAQTFTKIVSGPVVNNPGDSRSVNWVDLNNDGLIDLFISNGKAGGQNNFYYLNNGGGNFTQVTNDIIVMDGEPSDGATFADCDNDGDLDAFVVNWYDLNNLFYTNDGTGVFTLAASGPLVDSLGYSETASWGDYDNDGLLDLYVTHSGGTLSTNTNLLYHNNGGNNFTAVSGIAPVTDAFISRCVNWTDMDGDGDLDLFVTNEGTTNTNENIYRNDGGGAFTKITLGTLVNNGGMTMSSSWADYDNDGDLDVFLSNDRSANALFRNNGNLSFTKIINDTVSKEVAHSFSSAWSDIDNDGDLDLFVTNSFYTPTKQVNFLYLNNGDGSFSRVSNSVLATDSSWSYGCAFGDYDNDGFEDLAVATVNFKNVDDPDFLYHNDGNSNHWITIKLVGTVTNKSAIGTKIRVKAVINGTPVWQLREISAQTSYCGENDLRAHFGLRDAVLIDSIKVEWLSGLKEYFTNIDADQFVTITEGGSLAGVNTISDFDFAVFPNPVSSSLTITSDKNILESGSLVELTDTNGSVVLRQKILSNTFKVELDLSHLSAKLNGVYYVSVINTSGKFVKKIVKL